MKHTLFFIALLLPSVIFAQTPTVGLIQHLTGSLDDGYVFFAPIRSDTTYLIDKCGKKVHQWFSPSNPGLSAYFLPDGTMLSTQNVLNPVFNASGAAGGRIERLDWNSNILWSYTISDTTETQNHDICPLPNGNILVVVWENISTTEAIAAGRDPSILGTSIWSAKLEEIQPIGTDSANIVWQWRLWDHLVQDFDAAKSNYGVVADHPELLNLNFNGTSPATQVDWIHLNGVAYNAASDQIMISAHNLSEIYIIDHSTTTAQAAAHSGGTHGKGGDFLYRWGNPQSYNRGTSADRKLYAQHNPTWIPQGYAGAGNIMIFNNGLGRPGGNYSSVDVIVPPIDGSGNYSLTTGAAFGPAALEWSYTATVPTSFFSNNMGGAQRLSNGNTLICEATTGRFLEVDSAMNTVWEYINPVSATGPIDQGTTGTGTQVFRCIFYPDTAAGFSGHTLAPGSPIELNPYPYTCNLTTEVLPTTGNSIFALFPDPAKDQLNITNQNNEPIKSVELINLLGKTLYKYRNSSPTIKINISELPAGFYIVKINDSVIKKFIKE